LTMSVPSGDMGIGEKKRSKWIVPTQKHD